MERLFSPQQESLLESLKVPNTYWDKTTKEYRYWFRSLLQKVDSCLVFEGIPETWPKEFFLWSLWAFGFVGVFKTERFGVTFNPVTISGFDFYYEPTHCLVSNPLYTKQLKIHKDAELIRLTPDYLGIFDIINFYAKKLAELSKGIDMGIINTKLPMIMTAANQAQAKTLKKVYDKVQSGETLVVYDDIENLDEVIPMKDPFTTWMQDFKQTYIVTELLENLNSVLDDFYTEIGLPVSLDKKSHVLDSEAGFQRLQSQARLSCWLDNLTQSINLVNKKFNLNISVSEKLEEGSGHDAVPNDFNRN